jgi:hypothetical protein
MPITLNCPCGKTLRVPDASAGKRARCPACQAVIDIPAPREPEPVFEVEEPAPTPGPSPAYKKPYADEDDEENVGTYGLAADEDDKPNADGKVRPPKKGLPNFRRGTDNHK